MNKHTLETDVEQHPAWKGSINPLEIAHFLSTQPSFTYIISQTKPQSYLLSYIRNHDRKAIHIHFRKVYNYNFEFCGFRNGSNIVFSSLEALIRYKLKGKGSRLEMTSLRICA
jgi:hypothetical protein